MIKSQLDVTDEEKRDLNEEMRKNKDNLEIEVIVDVLVEFSPHFIAWCASCQVEYTHMYTQLFSILLPSNKMIKIPTNIGIRPSCISFHHNQRLVLNPRITQAQEKIQCAHEGRWVLTG